MKRNFVSNSTDSIRNQTPKDLELFTKRDFLLSLTLSVFYILLSSLLVGFKTDQLVLVFIFNTLYYISHTTRKFIIGFSIFIVYWILFDYMKAFPNYWFNDVHIESLYQLEKKLFGINFHQMVLTPNEYWKLHTNSFLDLSTGLFYLMWIPVPLVFATYLFFKKKQQFLYFSLTFVLVNLIGFVGYYIYPAAPPWYVQEHGFSFYAHTLGSRAGLIRFDDFFDISLFKSIYSKGSNVFAAMPSLHSSYPVIVLYYGLKNKLGKVNIFFVVVMLGIWFAAVYTSHHYTLDVIAGIITALSGLVGFNLLLTAKFFKKYMEYMLQKIS
ncbi:PAP2 superfamily protein [Pedobacter sp. ok626]|uniref:phosphatase PAP2 family protein n=1 Tax=Pedobacter sp. ok626 TaxID=1761882 RepID=UPI00088C2DD1|nr:phosphatase PAP2 family protein [Pedobacter sp. ok626]SDJ79872.1 PAP2 superfamily protein [Pedobacter sp. ok626]